MTIVLIILLLFLIYSILPTIFYRLFHLGVFQKGRSDNQVALTFDDGPDPKYTPILLNLLRKYDVKATFFIVGENAKEHPDLIKRMHAEGHQIGLHHYRHLSNWFLFPHQIKKQCDMAAEVIEQIVGVRPIYYRPPWGHLNLLIPLIAKHYRIVIWSAILGDWRLKLGKERLKKRIIKSLYGGSVIVLHDRGTNIGADQRAPENTIAALEEIFEEKVKPYKYVTVDELYSHSDSK